MPAATSKVFVRSPDSWQQPFPPFSHRCRHPPYRCRQEVSKLLVATALNGRTFPPSLICNNTACMRFILAKVSDLTLFSRVRDRNHLPPRLHNFHFLESSVGFPSTHARCQLFWFGPRQALHFAWAFSLSIWTGGRTDRGWRAITTDSSAWVVCVNEEDCVECSSRWRSDTRWRWRRKKLLLNLRSLIGPFFVLGTDALANERKGLIWSS